MKKKLTVLLLTLVTALALCATAAASGSGSWGGSVNSGSTAALRYPIRVSGLASGQVGYLAGYNDNSRMMGLRIFSADGTHAAIQGATNYKLFRLGEGLTPQGEVLAFAPNDGTVRKVDDQVCVCYADLEGLAVTQPVTAKVTGKVNMIRSDGSLWIDGTWYVATELAVEGCAMPISTDGFRQWANLSAIYDFYLDAQGDICWIEQHADSEYKVCMPLSVQLERNRLSVWGDGCPALSPVTQLDGKAVADDPQAALDQLTADCGNAFYVYRALAGSGYALVRAEADSPVDTGYSWGQRYTIPAGSPIQPAADFTFGAIDCLADENTKFWVAVGEPGKKNYRTFIGTDSLPSTQASGCVIAGADGVAEHVYLDMLHFTMEPPEGCVFVMDNMCYYGSYMPSHRTLNIVDAKGARASLSVSDSIAKTVERDSMALKVFGNNTYVGKFCRITALDQNGITIALESVRTSQLLTLNDSHIFTALGQWYCGSDTTFVYVDLGQTYASGPNAQLVRKVTNYGSFDPANFFRPGEVGEDKTYSSVQATVIPSLEDETLADYVYVVRMCNETENAISEKSLKEALKR